MNDGDPGRPAREGGIGGSAIPTCRHRFSTQYMGDTANICRIKWTATGREREMPHGIEAHAKVIGAQPLKFFILLAVLVVLIGR